MLKNTSALLLVSLLFCATTLAQEVAPAKLKKIDQLVEAYVEAKVINSVAIGIFDNGAETTKGYGRLSIDNPEAPNGDTVFEIGSTSKVFTGVLLADAINRGLMKSDQPVDELLPEGVSMPVYKKRPNRKVTLMHLSTHVSGLPRMPDNFDPTNVVDPYVDYSAKDLYQFLNSYELTRKPGIFFEYSNLGVGLLGQLLAEKQDSTYEELLTQRIAKPLGMSSTSLTLSKDQKMRLAPPHLAGGNPATNWVFDSLAGAGGISSTANDMLKFAKANLSPPQNETGTALKLAFEQQRKSVGFNSTAMGFGWMINAHDVRFHNGQTGGYHSMLFVSPGSNRALVVLGNTATPEVDRIAADIMALLHGRDVPPRKFRKKIEVSRELCQRYVGKYALTKTVIIKVEFANAEQTELTVQLTGQSANQIFPESETLWYLKVVDADFEFQVDDEGNCTAVVLDQNGVRQTAKRLQ
jgi:CubicO group peptidase (beta-lactamase class C family)